VSSIQVVRLGPQQIPLLGALLRAIAVETTPQDPAAPDKAEAGLHQALERYDFSRSDCFWTLLATWNAEPAGYAAVCRIPKADARAGFLFIDELHVRQAYRRRGIARALLAHVEGLAQELGLAGVRLLARPENSAARRLYRSAGFAEGPSIFYEKRRAG
jgi:ribosomal protein S18 acetylase RimI-like enzyme